MQTTRRAFCAATLAAVAASSAKANETKQFELPALPFAEDALEPVISARTLSFHWGKHHRTYVETLNKLVANTQYAGLSLEEVLRKAKADGNAAVFNNAAQAWNHTFYWNSLAAPSKVGVPSRSLLRAIDSAFGSLDDFKKAFADKAGKQFGSGWAWLVADKSGKLSLISTPNAETPASDPALKPLLTIDVWEHAYYLDWQNRRAAYAEALVSRLLNWNAASARFE